MSIDQMKFCPQCGDKTLAWDKKQKWSCKTCGFILFHNVAAAVAVLFRCGDEILLTRRNQEPGNGKLDLPGGFVDPAESAEQTCVRETAEELGININIEKLNHLASLPNVYEYKDISYNTLDLFYEYEVEEKFALRLATDEISVASWFKAPEIVVDNIAFASQKTFLAAYKELFPKK